MKGTLTPEQSQFLGQIGQTPLCYVHPELKEQIINAYLDSDSTDLIPDDLDEEIKLSIEFAKRTGDKALEMDFDTPPLEIVFETESPFPDGDDDGEVDFTEELEALKDDE